MELLKSWIENLRKYETLKELQQSAFFAESGRSIDQFLSTPQIFSSPGVAPRLHSFLRVGQWNIEKGKRFEAIVRQIQSSEILQQADVVLLNEADWGMNRSHNLHVAKEIAGILGMHMAFAPAYMELTKGVEEELCLEGENLEGLQGNAILSRYPISEACVIRLPVSFEPYEFHEKRYGQRNCLWARLQLPKFALWVGATHLELRNSPQCRAEQMLHILEHLPGDQHALHLLGGDLNTNSFGRGTMRRTVQAILRLLWTAPPEMKKRLLHPEWGAEPLFRELHRQGFRWDGFNTYEETARAAIGALEEAEFLPDFVLHAFRKRLESYQGYLCFKLDWFFGRNVHALRAGEKFDEGEGISSMNPGCVRGVNFGPERISDHLPIYVDLDLA